MTGDPPRVRSDLSIIQIGSAFFVSFMAIAIACKQLWRTLIKHVLHNVIDSIMFLIISILIVHRDIPPFA